MKYTCLADLLFIFFGFNYFAYDELKQLYLFGQIQTNQEVSHTDMVSVLCSELQHFYLEKLLLTQPQKQKICIDILN